MHTRLSVRLAIVLAAAATTGLPVSALAAGPLPGQTFTLAWGGDVTPGSDYGMPPDHGRGLLAGVAERFRGADIATANLEGTLGLGGPQKCAAHARPDCFAFQAPADNALVLWSAGIDVVNLANNHAFDYGVVGARLTVGSLDRYGIGSTGHAGEISYVDLPRTRVAFLGFAAYPWASPIRDLPAVHDLVARAARHANVVVVFMHAGAEGAGEIHTPDHDEQAFGELRGNPRAFAHTAVDAGADLVVGSGPHVLRGIELYRDRLVAYSLGNLAGYRNFGLGGRTSLSGLLRVRLGPGGAFAAGTFDSLRLRRLGFPEPDASHASARLVNAVSAQDFRRSGMRVRDDGTLAAR